MRRVPVFLDPGKIDDASDQGIEGAVICVGVGDINPAVGQTSETGWASTEWDIKRCSYGSFD
jgi:hypothetical protein